MAYSGYLGSQFTALAEVATSVYQPLYLFGTAEYCCFGIFWHNPENCFASKELAVCGRSGILMRGVHQVHLLAMIYVC